MSDHFSTLAPAASHRTDDWRHAVSVLLRTTGAALDRLALRVEQRRRPANVRALEYYAEAGAPEGALYADGRLVGWITGVNRL